MSELLSENEAAVTAMLRDRGFLSFARAGEDKLIAHGRRGVLEVVFVNNVSLPETRKYEDDGTRRLFVCKTKTSRAVKAVPPTVQIWLTKELKMAGVFKRHRLMPDHRLLTEAERGALENAHQWPKVKWTDPMSRYYGALPGDVFRIDEVCWEGAKVVRYRIVVV